jgi:thioesterase domain-containing protein
MIFSSTTTEEVSHIFNLGQQPEIVQTVHSPPSPGHSKQPPPLFLIHDGSGICIHYHRLRSLHRPVYALHNPKFFDPFDDWANLGEMADEYAKEIASTTGGPYLLGGWSFGGVVAFEVARRLTAQGNAVVGTILIDSPPPINHQPLSSRIIEAVTGQGKSSTSETAQAIRSLTRHNFAACASLLSAFIPELPEKLSLPRVFLLRSRQGWEDTSNPQFFENIWLQDRSDPRTAVAGWEVVTGSVVPWMDIPGDHFQAFDAVNIDTVSDAIRQASLNLEASFHCPQNVRSL